eukprot:m.920074 g.920074  ORF g.920074 m.920074 type:complete len:417 (-) comp61055_c0_seq1:97-1347(-)
MAPKLKLTYFDFAGLAEPARLAFFIGGVEFEDERLTGDQFKAQKAAGRFPNDKVPVLWVDDQPVSQSNAILTYAAKAAGFYPTDPFLALKVDEVLSNFADVGALFTVSAVDDQEKKKALRLEIAHGPLTVWAKRFDDALGKSASGYFVGESLSPADLKAYSFFVAVKAGDYDFVPKTVLDQFTNIDKFLAKIKSHPKIVEYYTLREAASKGLPKLKLTYFNIPGRAESIRLALKIGRIPFIDERISGADFGAQRAAGRFKNDAVPVLEIDGVQHAQSNALTVYAGSLAGKGLVPADALGKLKVNEVLESIENAGEALSKSLHAQDAAQKLEMRQALISESGALTVWLQRLDRALELNGSGYFVGPALTVADLKALPFFNWLSGGVLDGIPKEWIKTFPRVTAFQAKVSAEVAALTA